MSALTNQYVPPPIVSFIKSSILHIAPSLIIFLGKNSMMEKIIQGINILKNTFCKSF